MRRAASAFCFCVAMLVGSSAHAQEADASTRAAALVEHALDLRETGDDVQARALIAEAHALSPTPRSAAQLGLVEQALGLWADAERHLHEAVTHADDDWIRAHRRALDHSLEIIATNLGSLEVLANVEGATVSIRGSVVATLPSPAARVQVGSTEFVVAAPQCPNELVHLFGVACNLLGDPLVARFRDRVPRPSTRSGLDACGDAVVIGKNDRVSPPRHRRRHQ